MMDVQNLKDKRGININEVGIIDLKIPLFFGDANNKQQIIADVKMGVSLPANLKGTHMSRFIEIAEEIFYLDLSESLIIDVLRKIRKRLKTDYSKVEFSFLYFLNKKTPISGKNCRMGYKCCIGRESIKEMAWNVFEVEIPIATLCPCSKEISEYGAHNQNGAVAQKRF